MLTSPITAQYKCIAPPGIDGDYSQMHYTFYSASQKKTEP